MLDGNVNRQYLSIAEASEQAPSGSGPNSAPSRRAQPRAFTTLSSTLGDMTLQLHEVRNPKPLTLNPKSLPVFAPCQGAGPKPYPLNPKP